MSFHTKFNKAVLWIVLLFSWVLFRDLHAESNKEKEIKRWFKNVILSPIFNRKNIFGFKLKKIILTKEKIILEFNDNKKTVNIILEKRNDKKTCFSRTKSFNIYFKGKGKTPEEVARLLAVVSRIIKERDKGSFDFEKLKNVSYRGENRSKKIEDWVKDKDFQNIAGFSLVSIEEKNGNKILTFKNRLNKVIKIKISKFDPTIPALVKIGNYAVLPGKSAEISNPTVLKILYKIAQKLTEIADNDGEADTSPEEGKRGILSIQFLEKYIVAEAILLLFLWFVSLFYLVQFIYRFVKKEFTSKERLLTIVILFLAIILRFFVVPPQLVTLYFDYFLTSHAITLFPLPRYGASSFIFYHLFLYFLPKSHYSLILVDTVISIFIILFLGIIYKKFFRDKGYGVVLLMLFYAVFSLFLRNDRSINILIPGMLFLSSGVMLFYEYCTKRKFFLLFLSLSSVVLSAFSRPEMIVIAPVLFILFAYPEVKKSGRNFSFNHLWFGTIFFVVFFLWGVVFVYHKAVYEVSYGNLPLLSQFNISSLVNRFFKLTVLFKQEYFPCYFMFLITVGTIFLMVKEKDLYRSLLFIVIVFLWYFSYIIDFNEVSMLRLHAYPTMILSFLGVYGFMNLQKLFSSKKMKFVANVLLSFGFISATLVTISPTFKKTNYTIEEELILKTLHYLKPYPSVTFVRRGFDDIPSYGIHLFYPDYLFHPPQRNDTIYSIHKWIEKNDFSKPVFFFCGVRCYAATGAIKDHFHPLCRLMFEHYELKPVFEEVIPNLKERDFLWYEGLNFMKVGLYRVLKKENK